MDSVSHSSWIACLLNSFSLVFGQVFHSHLPNKHMETQLVLISKRSSLYVETLSVAGFPFWDGRNISNRQRKEKFKPSLILRFRGVLSPLHHCASVRAWERYSFFSSIDKWGMARERREGGNTQIVSSRVRDDTTCMWREPFLWDFKAKMQGAIRPFCT